MSTPEDTIIGGSVKYIDSTGKVLIVTPGEKPVYTIGSKPTHWHSGTEWREIWPKEVYKIRK